ncbi:ribonuclease E activity regulator RraA [Cytobacillus spongiae]|uniref:ribonuclease E activity regulator RraA n=1 Tax=Cytobacillus spongiae TaxID=2901381 RepID=UPI001F3D5B0D|nr:ribonuclease E activity regulator RraA [Cytobacillus spongiae]UII56476.1 ribonuclease E activity regulator RraA [Cytobacillus spongiae]
MTFKTADLCDDFASELKIAEGEFKTYGRQSRFHGPISTVRVFEDNVLVKESLETIPSGAVLVVDGGASKACALMGDRLAGIAEARKLAGVIINGCVRDVAELAKTDIGILAIGSIPLKSKKAGKGEKDIPVNFAGIDWRPGHFVYADEDGVVVAERELL